jgi:hypothetical protein
LSVGLKVPEGKEILLNANESELLNVVVDFFPHKLSINPELEESSVFEADEKFEIILLVGVLMQFFYFAEREVH